MYNPGVGAEYIGSLGLFRRGFVGLLQGLDSGDRAIDITLLLSQGPIHHLNIGDGLLKGSTQIVLPIRTSKHNSMSGAVKPVSKSTGLSLFMRYTDTPGLPAT
jgi:hypothetical protein